MIVNVHVYIIIKIKNQEEYFMLKNRLRIDNDRKPKSEKLSKITNMINKVYITATVISMTAGTIMVYPFAADSSIYNKSGADAAKVFVNGLVAFLCSLGRYAGMGCLCVAVYNVAMTKVNDEPNGLQKAAGFGIAGVALMSLKSIFKVFGFTVVTLPF